MVGEVLQSLICQQYEEISCQIGRGDSAHHRQQPARNRLDSSDPKQKSNLRPLCAKWRHRMLNLK